MKTINNLSRHFIALVVAVGLLPTAFAQPLETGWMSDTKGSTDPKTKATVVLVSNLNGSQERDGTMKWAGRYIGLEIPQRTVNVNRIYLIGEDGKSIPHRHPETFASGLGQNGENATFLKLFVDRPPGFKFKLRVEE